MASARSTGFWATLFSSSKPKSLADYGIPDTYKGIDICCLGADGKPEVVNSLQYNLWVKEVGSKKGFQPVPIASSAGYKSSAPIPQGPKTLNG